MPISVDSKMQICIRFQLMIVCWGRLGENIKWPECSARVPFRIKKDPGSREANKSKAEEGGKGKSQWNLEREREEGRKGEEQIKSKSRERGNCFIINNVQALHWGPSIYDAHTTFRIFYPLPLVCIFTEHAFFETNLG